MNKETKNSILIVANGKSPKKQLLHKLKKESECIIAADGGANICYKNGISPDYIIGDFDSVKKKVKKHFKSAEFIHLPNQDEHDLLKALTFCQDLNPKKVIITAAFGKRVDHTLSNLFMFQQKNYPFILEFVDNYGKLFFINNSMDFHLTPGQTVSFISFLPVFGITLKGFKYPVVGKDYPEGFNGVSNQVVNSSASVIIKQGSLFAFFAHE